MSSDNAPSFYKYFFIFILGFTVAWLVNFLNNQTHLEDANNIDHLVENLSQLQVIDDLSWQELQQLNQQLRQQIAQLKTQLTKLEASQKITITQTKTPTKAHKKPANMRFLSVKFMKKNLPPINYIIPPELKKALDLTEEQSKALALLLHDKMNTDLDIIAPIFDELAQGSVEQLFSYGESGQIENELLAQQVNDELQSQQSYFENTLSNILSVEQINAYYDYEVKRAKQQHKIVMDRQARVIKRIPDLEPYQQDEIQRFFDEQSIDLNQVAIASNRNPLRIANTWISADFKSQLENLLETMLTPEQLNYYQENIALNF